LRFDPAGSVFVVFRESSNSFDPVTTFTRNGQGEKDCSLRWTTNGQVEMFCDRNGKYQITTRSGKQLQVEVEDLPKPFQLEGKWDVSFPPGLGAPEHVVFERLISWIARTNTGVKYFSGAATYSKTFELPPDFLGSNRRMELDLGNVEVIAEVTLNGQDLGILWKPPFRVDVSHALKAGENQLQVKVINLWPNRLIGDEQLPDDCEWRTHGAGYGDPLLKWPEWLVEGKPRPTSRIAFSTWKHWQKEAGLLESGLIGPVRIMCEEHAILREKETLNR
jgi:hypothetical protein